jgi:hypothetical protein
MQVLIDYNYAEDIEVFGNNLYFMVSRDRRKIASIQQLILSVTELSVELKENARLSTPAKVAPSTGQPVVATQTSQVGGDNL